MKSAYSSRKWKRNRAGRRKRLAFHWRKKILSLNDIDTLDFLLSEYLAKAREIEVLESFRDQPGISRVMEIKETGEKLARGKITEKIYVHLMNEIQQKNLDEQGQIAEELLVIA